ncbi:hypothetical protein D3C80_1468800 [compost metagenome]
MAVPELPGTIWIEPEPVEASKRVPEVWEPRTRGPVPDSPQVTTWLSAMLMAMLPVNVAAVVLIP